MGITERKRKYAEGRLSGKNQKQAALDAGVPPKGAAVEGHRLEKDPEVVAYIEAEQKRLQSATGITREKWLNELAAVGFSRISTFARWGEGAMVLTPTSQLSETDLRSVLQVEERSTDKGPVMKLKLHDKNKALETIGRALGFFKDPADSGAGITSIRVVVEDYTDEES